jgi:glyoxylase-like metal-dependent hydrolase (beta-lactamase superfamily II)
MMRNSKKLQSTMANTRRAFLKHASFAAGISGAGGGQTANSNRDTNSFRPSGALRKITDNLFVFEDTCNVYVVRDGSRCILVDFGSGGILEHLRDAGIDRIDYILHTHHHRDQCQGDHHAVARGIPIAVPRHEKHLFADAENFWRNRRVFHLYYVRNDFNTITRNIPVSAALTDYSIFRWRNTEVLILPTPGHTLGSITLLASIDGKRVAFSGDLMYSPGKIVTLYDTQVTYNGEEGVDLGIYSLNQLVEQKPELLCPSHGDVLADPQSGIRETMRRLRDYFRIQFSSLSVDNRPYAVSPHLIASYRTTSSFYAIVSDSGKALFVDYGAASDRHFSAFMGATAVGDRIRFVEHTIGDLKRDFGVKSIDVAMPSHMHDDHLNGFPHLVRRYGAKIWCYENMVDILENPRDHNLGCTLGEPIRVNRAFSHGERFRWEEFEFEVTHSPGHTEYQMALFTTIDGQRVAFTGDAFFQPGQPEGAMRHNIIFRNHVESDSHLKSIRNLIEHEPALIAPGHGKPYAVTKQMMATTEKVFQRQRDMFSELLPGEPNFGLDPSWLSIYPYQILLAPGDRQRIEIRVQNYNAAPMKIEAALVAPREWRIEPDVLRFEVAPHAKTRQIMQVSTPKSWTPSAPRFAIACDVVRDNRYLGQITEAVVEIAGAI